MRTHIIATIFRKEIKEVLRDKRMLYLVILLPFFLYPVLFTVIGGVGAGQREKLQSTEVEVWLSPGAEDTPLERRLTADSSLKVHIKAFTANDLDSLRNTIGVLVPADFGALLASGQIAEVEVLADQSRDVLAMRQRQLTAVLDGMGQEVVQQRLAERELDPSFLTPIVVQQTDLSPQQNGNRMMTMFLPLMILLFIFIGCIYIAIDITAGEKERKTLQTLFTAPTTTREIIAGKFLAVATVGIVSAAMNLLSLLLAMYIQARVMGEETTDMAVTLEPAAWAWLGLLVLLTTLFLGAISLAVVLLANSYKEAQSYVSPLMMLVLIPAMLAGMPGMELNLQTALIPVFNIALAIIALFKGNWDPSLLSLVAAAGLVYGLVALWLTSLTFGNENVVTGEKFDWKQLFSSRH
jgi:sodium transport system permease protein